MIDAVFEAAGWVVQDRDELNLAAATGVAVREFQAGEVLPGAAAGLNPPITPLPFLYLSTDARQESAQL